MRSMSLPDFLSVGKVRKENKKLRAALNILTTAATRALAANAVSGPHKNRLEKALAKAVVEEKSNG
jgi:hypothetical protein